ncbi:disulfide bond formation protein B [Ancylobacter pratisalsi]|uniref:Disulfide bond formation protein B n=1 Tax=Ancylobacter pratisalsi TaxID=1745854 RepID=A0A6P1YNF2_9HYPH|nr:disulfide bond formation protein B [Ancylobacter pratisalsi]QIB34869.1 disulfide bond formation protein B [Ancylobacter pratisalsi]
MTDAANTFLTPERARVLNGLGVLAISAVLVFAFFDQFVGGDLPCPLCILQRVGFVGVGFGLALNLRFGPRPSHYGVAILSAVAGGDISVRQTLLHIVPGTGTYGEAFFGLHFYTWGVVLSCLIVVGCALLLLFDRQFEPSDSPPRAFGAFAFGAFGLVALLTLANGVSTVLECGGGLCPDNPTHYLLLQDAPPAP